MFCYKVFSSYHFGLNTEGLSSQIMCYKEYEVLYRQNEVCYPEKKDSLLFVFKRLKDALKYAKNEQIWICECDKLIEAPEYVAYPISDSIQCFWDNFDINNPTKKMPDYIAKRETPEGTYFTKWVIPLNRLK